MSETAKKTWGEDKKLAFEVWKYYGGIGGDDKNKMIQIVSWLLGFSAAIIGLYASGKLTEPVATVLLIVLGILVSILAAFTALLYGGYATWNWTIADQIAKNYEWPEQCPDYKPFAKVKAHRTALIPLWFAKPRQNKIAPVFWMFFVVSVLSFGVHAVLLVYAVRSARAQPAAPKQTMLLSVDLEGTPGKEAKMWITEIAPGGSTPRHFHPGDVVTYMLEGSVIHTIEGREPVTFSAGQAWHEAAKEIHWGSNTSPATPVKILSIQITDKGQPPNVLVK